MKKCIYFLLILILASCSENNPEPDPVPLSTLSGRYSGSIQHDVIVPGAGGLEEIDTTLFSGIIEAQVNVVEDELSVVVTGSDRYQIPELRYEIYKVEQGAFFNQSFVTLRLLSRNQYRERVRETDPLRNYSFTFNEMRSNMTLFLRSQDPDSVYNIWIQGEKMN